MSVSKSTLLLVLALATGGASAAPNDEVHAAFEKFLAAKSFRATVTDVKKGQQISSMEFLAPDRYHIVSGQAQAEQIIIGNDVYTMIDGRPMRLPIPVQVGRIVGQYRNAEAMERLRGNTTVTVVGDDDVDGEPARVYAYSMTEPSKSDSKLWISTETGLPLQIESTGTFMHVKSTVRVRYSDFDSTLIRIAAPR